MGFFRRIKVDGFTEAQLEERLARARGAIIVAILRNNPNDLEPALEQWAVWREALARKRDENHSPLDAAMVAEGVIDALMAFATKRKVRDLSRKVASASVGSGARQLKGGK